MLWSSCKPSLYQIQQYETSHEIKEGTLLVQLVDERENIALLKKYNRIKKAARLEAETLKVNQKIKKAFYKNYKYSNHQFIYKKEWIDSLKKEIKFDFGDNRIEVYQSENLFYCYFSKGFDYSREQEQENATIHIVELSPQENSFLRKIEYTSLNNDHNNPRYNYLVRMMNAKLFKLVQKREKILSK